MNRGWFQPGEDPRRHTLTTEERRRGYDRAVKGRGVRFVRWLCSRVASTARPANAERHKQRVAAGLARSARGDDF